MATTDTVPESADITTTDQTDNADDACVACTHPWSKHDVISARFCTATAAGALSRGCVCPHQ